MERIRTEGNDPDVDISNKPLDRPYFQQTMRAWSPLLTPWRAVGGYLLIGLIFVPLGAFLWVDSDNVVEMRYQYDGSGSDGESCKIQNYKEDRACNISFEIEEDMEGPVYVYYELSNFYQNHATYVASVYTDQLQGSTSTSSLDDCSPLEYNGSLVLHPCGLIANTLFNDVITVSSGQNMSETSIAWASDIAEKFSQPDGFVSSLCNTSDCATCLKNEGYEDSDGGETFSGCAIVKEDEENYAYYYPYEDDTQYLYETFPEVISPLVGVEDEHFIVWMRTSGLSKFRKLYGKIEDGLSADETLTFSVNANFIVHYYDGKKALVISTSSGYGGRNPYWGQSFPTIGAIVLVLAALIAVKQKLWPRPMGEISKLFDSL